MVDLFERMPHQEAGAERLDKLEALARGLGFEETEEMEDLEGSISEVPSLEHDKWRDLAENSVVGSMDYIRAQIGLLLTELAIYLKTGNEAAFEEGRRDASEYAFAMGFEDIAKAIDNI